MLRKSTSARLSAREAPSMRPSPAGCSGASSADGIWSVAAWLPLGSDLLSCRLFNDGLLAAFAAPMVRDRDLTRLPSQNASKMPSNLSQSDFRAENRCLNAERSRLGFSA